MGLIGPNGAGKTTFIDAVTGFVRAETGEVVLGDTNLGRLPPFKRARAGVLRTFQSLELFEDFTVWDNFQVATDPRDRKAYVTNLFRPERRKPTDAAAAVIQSFSLSRYLDASPGDLPYGTRRLLGLARVVACTPNTLLLDEPGAGLDPHDIAQLISLLKRLATEWKVGILLVEHEMQLVMGVCDRIVALDFGRVICAGTPAEVRSDPAVIRAYLGEPDESESPRMRRGEREESVRTSSPGVP